MFRLDVASAAERSYAAGERRTNGIRRAEAA